MKKYIEFKKELEQSINSFPMMFAFSSKQFEEGKKKLGVTGNKELVSIGAGGYIRKTDKEAFIKLSKSDSQREKEYLKVPEQLKDAFIYELGNHEYCINYNTTDALEALGLNRDKLTKKQQTILAEAVKEYLEMCEENEDAQT